MNPQIATAVISFLGVLAGGLITAIAMRPKTAAEAHHAEAQATTDIITLYVNLLQERNGEIAQLKTALAQAKRDALMVPKLTANIETLENDLRKKNQLVAALRGELIKEKPTTGGSGA